MNLPKQGQKCKKKQELQGTLSGSVLSSLSLSHENCISTFSDCFFRSFFQPDPLIASNTILHLSSCSKRDSFSYTHAKTFSATSRVSLSLSVSSPLFSSELRTRFLFPGIALVSVCHLSYLILSLSYHFSCAGANS